MTHALDTNVLVRYLVKDDADQGKAASDYIRARCTRENPAFINRIVLCELVWVLTRNYRFSREQIADVLEKIFQTRQFIIENAEMAWQALRDYRQSKADYADVFIGMVNTHAGYPVTVTFDKTAAELKNFQLLKKTT